MFLVFQISLLMVGEVSPEWSDRLLGEKFRFHNAQWIEMVQWQQLADISSMCQVTIAQWIEMVQSQQLADISSMCQVTTAVSRYIKHVPGNNTAVSRYIKHVPGNNWPKVEKTDTPADFANCMDWKKKDRPQFMLYWLAC